MKVPRPVTSDYGWNSGSMGITRYRRRSNVTIAVILVVGAVLFSGIAALVVLLLSSGPEPRHFAPPSPTASSTMAAASAPYDPYPVYFLNSPIGERHLTREQAQARAYLGCGQTFAPGTVDAVLADAYRPTGICSK